MAGQGQAGPGLPPQPTPQEQGPPQHQMPQPPPGLQQGPPPPQGPFQPGGQYGPPVQQNGYPAQAPQPTASPGGAAKRPGPPGRGPGAPATPNMGPQHHDQRPGPLAGPSYNSHIANVGNALAELDLERLPEHQKKVEADWFAIFNPQVPRVLDVDLLHTLQHESVVCCVRFSHDGKYVATGCNRAAQIFDVVTGQKVCVLQDDTAEQVGDLYIRSVCFSPDGKYLATGAEDKLIRVWDIQSNKIRNTFAGHEQDIYSQTSPRMAVPLPLAVVTVRFVCGILRAVSISWRSPSRTVSRPSPSLRIPTTSRRDLSTRALGFGISPLDSSSSVSRVRMGIRTRSTRLRLHRMARTSCLGLWTRRSRCGSCRCREADTQTPDRRAGDASRHSRDTRSVRSPIPDPPPLFLSPFSSLSSSLSTDAC